jgi:hypothetical protein
LNMTLKDATADAGLIRMAADAAAPLAPLFVLPTEASSLALAVLIGGDVVVILSPPPTLASAPAYPSMENKEASE